MKAWILLLTAAVLNAAEPDWTRIGDESLELLRRYIRIESINPPADTRKAAALFEAD